MLTVVFGATTLGTLIGAIVGGSVYLLVALRMRSAINSATVLGTSSDSCLYGPRPTSVNTYSTPLPGAE